MGLLEDTKKIYNWEPSDGDYNVHDGNVKRKLSLKGRLKKYIPITTIVVLVLILLTFVVSYYID
jgi:hypothetical protein